MQVTTLLRPRRGKPRAVEIAPQTGPLDILNGQHVLVLADAQNLDLGARDLGFKVSWAALARKLAGVSRSAACHVFLSETKESESRKAYFEASGWTAHVKESRTIEDRGGIRRECNVDLFLAVHAGTLISHSVASLIVLCSGDGALVENVAEAAFQFPKARRIATLSLAGSTAARLNAETSPYVGMNMELGLDCLQRRFQVSVPNFKGGFTWNW